MMALALSGCITGNGGQQSTTTAAPLTTTPPPTTTEAPTTLPPSTPAAEIREPGDHGDVPWQRYDDAFQKAREGDSFVFMYFWRDQCVFCNSMSSSTFIDQEVVSYLEDHFGIVDIDIWSSQPISAEDPSLSGEVLNAMFRPPGVPAMAILDSDGNILIGISGYKSSSDLLTILEYVVSGSYETMTLDEYVNGQ